MKTIALVLLYAAITFPATLGQEDGEFRLVNDFNSTINFNSADHIGRLEVFLNGSWGTVCLKGFDFYEADIVCRELGFLYAYRFNDVGSLDYLQGNGAIHLSDVDCLLNSTRIQDCNVTYYPSNCDHSEDMLLDCTNLENAAALLRLVSQTGRTSVLSVGRLEIIINEECGTVCSNSFDMTDADVACQELGFERANSFTTAAEIGFPLAPSSVPIWLDDLQCTPNDTNLRPCPQAVIGINDCQHSSDVILSCVGPGALRLVGDSTALQSSGRLEIYFSNEWGTVCSDLFSATAADIACRQVGFSGASQFGPANLLGFSEGSDRIWLDEVACTSGSDVSLVQCRHEEFGIHNCDHTQDIALRCSSSSSFFGGCIDDGDIRLVDANGDTFNFTSAGRVEVFHNGLWGTICNIDFDVYEGDIICRQLGFLYVDVVGVVGDLGFLEGTGSIKFGNFDCSLMNTRILGCSRMPFPVCLHHQDVAVRCASTGSSLRLVSLSGRETHAGRLEIFINNTWGTVCADNFDIHAANVACHQLGFDGGIGYSTAALLRYPEVPPTVPIWLDDIKCSSNETDIRLCDHAGTGRSDCQHDDDIILSCRARGSVRLVQSSSESTILQSLGRLEIYEDGEWGTVCSDSFSKTEADVACQQLGFNSSATFGTVSDLGVSEAAGSTAVFDVECSESDQTLLECRRSRTSCDNSNDVALNCSTSFIQKRAFSFTGIIIGVVIPIVVLLVILPTVIISIELLHRRQARARAEAIVPKDTIMLRTSLLERHHRMQGTRSIEIPDHLLIYSKHLKLKETIGQGQFGIVYKAHHCKNMVGEVKETVAVKTLKGFMEENLISSLLYECIRMSKFDHPNVLTVTGVCMDGGPVPYMVMPYMFNGDLLSYLKKERGNLVVPLEADVDGKTMIICTKLMEMCLQIATGMEYLAGRRVVHRDLACRNCMIDFNFVIKVADFGLSETIDPSKEYFRQGGVHMPQLPVKWLSPESLSDGVFSEKTDVWSFGVCCWEVFSGGMRPYAGIHPADVGRLLETGYRMSKPSNAACSDSMFDMMMRCWYREAEDRPTFTDLVASLSFMISSEAGYLALSPEAESSFTA